MSSSAKSPLPAETLESASSLAEAEHDVDFSTAMNNQVEDTIDKTKFYSEGQDKILASIEGLRDEIAADVLASETTFSSPFEAPKGAAPLGDDDNNKKYLKVPLIYCDQTASNRTVQSIEDYIHKRCLPFYGNTHTNTSITGAQSTAFVAEARQIVAEETNARITGKASLDVVLFAGSGTTAAVELLIDCMGLKHAATAKKDKQPVIFVGPHEHHSNLVPWRETGCEIVTVPECPTTRTVDYTALEKLLQNPSFHNRLKIGTFAAASNVNGKVADVDRIAAILHTHGALAFFDYATAAPYMKMDMNPPPSSQYPTPSLVAKDAIFLSPHKMIGGTGTPGVLIIKKHLVNQQNPPSRSGGGTVFYVNSVSHRFLSNRIDRYEGGTPNVVGILRVGLAFLFKRQVEQRFQTISNRQEAATDKESKEEQLRIPASLQDYEYTTYQRVASYLKEHAPNLILLHGETENSTSPHLPIFSFLIKCGQRLLHFNYVCAILNDVFGIQSRGGCQCAGPYSQRLLGLATTTDEGEVPNVQNKAIENALLHYKERAELLRPGYTRLSLPFKGLRSEEVEYVIKALVWTAKNGWALMASYRCNHRTGEWRHASRQGKPLGRAEREWLSHYSRNQHTTTQSSDHACKRSASLEAALANADIILQHAKTDRSSIATALKMNDLDNSPDSDEIEKLRWYTHPKDIAMYLPQNLETVPDTDSTELLGGLRPGSFFSAEPMISNEAMMEGPPKVRERKRKQVASDDEKKTEPMEIDRHPKAAKAETKVVENADFDTKNERKKPARGSESWGQGKFQQPKLCAVRSNNEPKKQSNAQAPESEASPRKQKKQKHCHTRPPAKMMRHVTQAVIQWNMIEDGDKLLLGLSGGKDSLSLLHCLLEYRRKMPINFEIEVCTIDPMTPSFDPSPLIPYVESLGLKYHYIKDDIVARANSAGKDGKTVSSLCAFCARMKRGNLYTCARKNNCNKLVLAQHLDDCAESFLMSVMHNGFLRTMKASYKIDAGDLSVIRPLVYCRESLMTEFAKSANLPVINENCPACFEEPKERARTKKLLAREEALYPHFYDNIRRSLIPLMHDDLSGILRGYTEEVVSKSRKPPRGEKGERAKGKGQPKKESPDKIAAELKADPPEEPSTVGSGSGSDTAKVLSSATEEELLMELARRKAARFQQAAKDSEDPTGMVCSLNGGNGTIPCKELME